MLDITKKNATVKFTKPFMKGEDGGYYWPEYNEEGQLIWQASEEGMPIIPPFDVKGEDGGYYTPYIDEAGELNWVPSNQNMPAVEGASLATREYVDEAVKDVEVDVDLSNYYTKEEVDEALANADVDFSNYYTKTETDAAINAAKPDLTDYALKSDIPSLDGYAKTTDIPDVSKFQTAEQVNAAIEAYVGTIENAAY